ncbi:family 16 glycoside hydrolase [Allostreptomyces psammosilenae]|uniref:Glucose/arabinose dehydrogenase n=1 Tax=Allostreptomyces psammosilenae TaxID=1892865 RepID=A0A853ABT3_9ACTN|nr:family 16 glycoside hydrolase [Allostreptomyces psammosilenae]NYI08051.1 glucose/arabinose dehydrogenase [Allostreptomyces psammosilenae]
MNVARSDAARPPRARAAERRTRTRGPRLGALLAGLLLALPTAALPTSAQAAPVAAPLPAASTPAASTPTGPAAGPAVVPDPADYQQVTLAKGVAETGEPMSLDVLPDGSVLHTSRDGTVRLTSPEGTTTVAGRLDVYTHDEEGLQGVAADPDFARNRHVFLYYAPAMDTPPGDAPADGTAADWPAWEGVNRLSRFTLRPDGTLDLASERRVLDIPADRGICCHVGGDIDFDAAGNLYLSTGDDTNPFASDGYSPIDERAGRNPSFDAQRTSANTNDLRGKILRIKVRPNGTYTIPRGNLFPRGTPGTRPEIYAMGFRNPFRMSVDAATGVVYVGDYGPDAASADPTRGPGGQVEFNRITAPGNFGWPYCTGENTPEETYLAHDFATGTSGERYDCAGGATNDSPRNTGLTRLPPAQPAWITYDDCSVPEFGCGSESPMGGPVYRYDADSDSAVKFPEELDGHFFAGEYGRRWIRTIGVGDDGAASTISPFPWSGTQVMDMAFGPDGALYVLDYGTGFFNGDHNSALYRIEYVDAGDRSPVASAEAATTSGPVPLTVAFSAAGSADPEGTPLAYSWDFGDGSPASTEPDPTHVYTSVGTYTATLTVTDAAGLTATDSVTVTAGNTAPSVTVTVPADGQLFEFGDPVPFEVTVTDPEDGPVDCSRVRVSYILGHDSHGHGLAETYGCSGTIQTPVDGEHDPNANIFGIIDASYTDHGAPGLPPLTGGDQSLLQPRHRQAEHHTASSGVGIIGKAGAEGGATVGDIHHGDWIAFRPYLLSGADTLTARVSSGGVGGNLEVRAGSPTGTLLGSVPVPVTGGWETFTTVSTPLAGLPTATTTLYLVFTGGGGALFDLDAFTLARTGTALFDGTAQSLARWRQAGPGAFTLGADGTITSSGGMGLLWYAEREYSSYSLTMDWRMAGDDNSGVFVGFPASDDPWTAVNNGYEIQIDATDAPDRTTGAVYSFQSADLAARDAALRPPGEWNRYEIRVEGERLRVYLNGSLINDFTSTDPARSLADGYVGIQNHGDGDEVSFRDIRIRELG